MAYFFRNLFITSFKSANAWCYLLVFTFIIATPITSIANPKTSSISSASQPAKNDKHDAAKVITVVIGIQLKPTTNRQAFLKASQILVDTIKKQPGLVDSDFFENINPALKPDFVHVMRWKNFQAWEKMITNGALDKLLEPIRPLCTIEPRAFTIVSSS